MALADAAAECPADIHARLLERLREAYRPAWPQVPFLAGLMEEARFWADMASRAELKAYALACWEAMPMPIILGNDPEDPGQAILWSASRSRAHFPFRLIFSDGVTMRRWSALIIALFDVFDSANAVMKMQATLRPVSAIERLEV